MCMLNGLTWIFGDIGRPVVQLLWFRIVSSIAYKGAWFRKSKPSLEEGGGLSLDLVGVLFYNGNKRFSDVLLWRM